MGLGIDGLWLNPNPDTQRPPGALTVADDIEIDKPQTAVARRDSDLVPRDSNTGEAVRAAFDYAGNTMVWDGEALWRSTLTTAGSWFTVDYLERGALYWSGQHLAHATLGGDLYVVTDDGPMALDGLASGDLSTPGVPRALDIAEAQIALLPRATGWMSDTGAAAYRVVWGKKDSEGRVILGEPSGRKTIFGEPGGPWTVEIDVSPPPGVTTTSGHFFQVYRTPPTVTAVDPGDSMFLVWEQPYTSGASVTVEDIDPYGLDPLYTNPDRGGIGSANVRPPLAQDIAPFRERLWLANTTAPQRLRLRFIAPPDPMAGHTVTINGNSYVLEVPNGTTVSEKIESAARWLILRIGLLDPAVQAIYSSGPYDPPGIVDIVALSNSTPSFTAQASIGGATTGGYFVPNLTAAVSSRADTYPNRLHYSRQGLGYAFPLPNTLQVGAEEHEIVRIAALKDTLFVFKGPGGDGLWKVTGNGPFYVEQVNSNIDLLAPQALAVANNTIIAWTNQGVVAITESGVDAIDIPIQNVFADLLNAGQVGNVRFVARQQNTEAKVYVGIPGTDGWVTHSYVYNLNTETWVRDTRGTWNAALVTGDNRLAYWGAEDNHLYLERNTGNRAADSEGVAVRIGWNAKTGGAPGTLKQFMRATAIFQEAQASSVDAEMWFTADDGTPGPAVMTGGEGAPYIRADVPFDQQVTSRLGVELRMTASQAHTFLGLDVTYRNVSSVQGMAPR